MNKGVQRDGLVVRVDPGVRRDDGSRVDGSQAVSRRRWTWVASVSTLVLAGCAATTSPRYDAHFGDSARMLQAEQTLDPAAPARHADKGVRSDGRSAAEATGRYVDSFRAPAPPAAPSITLNAGNASTGR